MPAGRPPLDPDIRDARRQESRRRYEAKNLAARRERAQVRMAKQGARNQRRAPSTWPSRHPCCPETPRFPRQDLSSHRRAALPAAGSHSDDGALSGDTTSSRHCTRAATPPIYEGGITARTRTVAPRVCPKCECEGCPGCMCMCPVSTEWIEHADGEAHFFPTCIECGGEDCPGCSCICPESTQLKEHGGHFEG
ncbi:hypothetical protein B0H14DRAFT_2601256 [Mycena olivaceomarginata]|nr:hypothetical protein B0H14DRAFT_2601256 [Mycena olivaceomarginata]